MLTITTDDKYMEECTEEILWVEYKNIHKVIDVGKKIYIDDGLISTIVKERGRYQSCIQRVNVYLTSPSV